MAQLTTRMECPACHHHMVPRVLACPDCGLRIESDFHENEFAGLEEDWLHFLRVFIHCEGRIRDMEAALGISYPTVKARIAELKSRLVTNEAQSQAAPTRASDEDTRRILDLLEAGEIDYDEAMRRLQTQ